MEEYTNLTERMLGELVGETIQLDGRHVSAGHMISWELHGVLGRHHHGWSVNLGESGFIIFTVEHVTMVSLAQSRVKLG